MLNKDIRTLIEEAETFLETDEVYRQEYIEYLQNEALLREHRGNLAVRIGRFIIAGTVETVKHFPGYIPNLHF